MVSTDNGSHFMVARCVQAHSFAALSRRDHRIQALRCLEDLALLLSFFDGVYGVISRVSVLTMGPQGRLSNLLSPASHTLGCRAMKDDMRASQSNRVLGERIFDKRQLQGHSRHFGLCSGAKSSSVKVVGSPITSYSLRSGSWSCDTDRERLRKSSLKRIYYSEKSRMLKCCRKKASSCVILNNQP